MFWLFDHRDILQQNDHFKSNPKHLPMYADYVYEHVIIVLEFP